MMKKGARAHSGLFYKGTNPVHAGFMLMTYSLPKDPPPNTIALGIRFQQRNFGGHKHSNYNTYYMSGIRLRTICPTYADVHLNNKA